MNIPRACSRSFVALLLAGVALPCAPRVCAQDFARFADESPFRMHGTVAAALGAYSASGLDSRQAPYSWSAQATATAFLYGVTMPFSFTITERERSFQQPFNEFGISPRYQWATLHLGYRSVPWSRYTNAGVRFLGADLELRPGDFECGFLYGRLQRAVEADSTNRYAMPAYKRTGAGFHLLIGNSDGNLRGSLFWARDDTTSLRSRPAGITPMENAVASAGALFWLAKGVSLDIDIAGSLLTRDLFSPLLSEGGISGRKQEGRIEKFNDYFAIHTSTSLAFAGRAMLFVPYPTGGVGLACEIIEPRFSSLGAYYFSTDMLNLTVNPSAAFLGGTLRAAASLGMQRDNVDGDKAATTTRWIGSMQANWDPEPAYGLGFQYGNYSSGQEAARMPLNDSIRVRSMQQNLSANGRCLLLRGDFRHVFTAVLGISAYTDLNAYTRLYSETEAATGAVSYTLMPAGGGWSGSAGLSHSATRSSAGRVHVSGVSVGASAPFFSDALQASASIGYSLISGAGRTASQMVTESISLSYAASGDDAFALALQGGQNRGGSAQYPQYEEFSAQLSYRRGFRWDPFRQPDVPTAP